MVGFMQIPELRALTPRGKLEKEVNQSKKAIEVLRKSLSIAAGMLYELYATCPEGQFPVGEVIVKKICVGDDCAVPPGEAAKCWGHYLIEKARLEIEREGL